MGKEKIKHPDWPVSREEYAKLLELIKAVNESSEKATENYMTVIDFLEERGLKKEFEVWALKQEIRKKKNNN